MENGHIWWLSEKRGVLPKKMYSTDFAKNFTEWSLMHPYQVLKVSETYSQRLVNDIKLHFPGLFRPQNSKIPSLAVGSGRAGQKHQIFHTRLERPQISIFGRIHFIGILYGRHLGFSKWPPCGILYISLTQLLNDIGLKFWGLSIHFRGQGMQLFHLR